MYMHAPSNEKSTSIHAFIIMVQHIHTLTPSDTNKHELKYISTCVHYCHILYYTPLVHCTCTYNVVHCMSLFMAYRSILCVTCSCWSTKPLLGWFKIIQGVIKNNHLLLLPTLSPIITFTLNVAIFNFSILASSFFPSPFSSQTFLSVLFDLVLGTLLPSLSLQLTSSDWTCPLQH